MENTGGGAYIAKDASVSGDFINRDQHSGNSGNSGNQVHVAMEHPADVGQRETDEIGRLAIQISALTRAIAGDPLLLDGKGLVQQVREMEQTNRRREWWRLTSTVALVLLVIMQAIQWWFIWRIYDLYWIIYRAVEAAN